MAEHITVERKHSHIRLAAQKSEAHGQLIAAAHSPPRAAALRTPCVIAHGKGLLRCLAHKAKHLGRAGLERLKRGNVNARATKLAAALRGNLIRPAHGHSKLVHQAAHKLRRGDGVIRNLQALPQPPWLNASVAAFVHCLADRGRSLKILSRQHMAIRAIKLCFKAAVSAYCRPLTIAPLCLHCGAVFIAYRKCILFIPMLAVAAAKIYIKNFL